MSPTTPPGTTPQLDPDLILDRDAYAAALRQLRAVSGLSIRKLAGALEIPTATLGGYFSGRHLPSAYHAESAMPRLLAMLGIPDDQLDAWGEALHRVRSRPGPAEAAEPWRGLASYRVEDSAWYVGREALCAAVLQRIIATLSTSGADSVSNSDSTSDSAASADAAARAGTPRILAVLGPSGSGKSSFVHAGVMAGLLAQGVPVAEVVYGDDPQAGLEAALAGLADTAEPAVIVLDQFETLLADTADPEQRRAVLARVSEACSGEPVRLAIVVLRADYLDKAMSEPELLAALDAQVLVPPLGREARRRVIVEPAARAGVTVEEPLVELLLNQTERSTPLPLLSHVLRNTWLAATNTQLTASDYLRTGGFDGAVGATAESVYDTLSPQAQQLVWPVFSRLVSVAGNGMPIRRRLSHAEVESLDEAALEVVDAFLEGRILVADAEGLEITHDVVLSAWPRLADWIAGQRDGLRARARVAQFARAWDESGRDNDSLLRGPALALAVEVRDRAQPPLAALEQEYVAAGEAARDLDLEHQARSRRVLRLLTASATVFALVTSVLAVVLWRANGDANQARRTAETARREALSRQIATEARDVNRTDPALGAQLGLAAFGAAETVQGRSALLSTSANPLSTRLTGPAGGVRALVTPDGRTLAVAAADGVVRVYDRPADGAAPRLRGEVTIGEGGPLYAAALSPEGLLAVGGGEATVTLVEVSGAGGPRIVGEVLDDPESTIQSLVWAGDTLFAATSDPAVFAWEVDADAAATSVRVPDAGFTATAYDVATSADGTLVAAAGADERIVLWRRTPSGWQRRAVLPGTGTFAWHSVALDPTGRLMVAGQGQEGGVHAWRVPDTGAVRRVRGPAELFPSWVNDLAFDASGERLVGVSSNSVVQTWQVRDWRLLAELPGTGNYTSVQFAPDPGEGSAEGGQPEPTLVTGAIDGTTRLWQIDRADQIRLPGDLWSLSITGDGTRAYAADVGTTYELELGDEGRVRQTGRVFGPGPGHTSDAVSTVSPDGRMLYAGSNEGAIDRWLLGDKPRLLSPVSFGEGAILATVFTADGALMASATSAGQVAVFDTSADPEAKPRKLGSLELPDAQSYTMAMGPSSTPDEALIAVGSDSGVHVLRWDGTTLREEALISEFDGSVVYGLAFSPDHQRLATGGSDHIVRVWSLDDLSQPQLIGAPQYQPRDTIWSLLFMPGDTSADGSTGPEQLVGVCADGYGYVWTVTNSDVKPHNRLEGNATDSTALVAVPGTMWVLMAGFKGRLAAYDLAEEAVTEAICRTAGSAIKRDEWAAYVPGAAYHLPCGE